MCVNRTCQHCCSVSAGPLFVSPIMEALVIVPLLLSGNEESEMLNEQQLQPR